MDRTIMHTEPNSPAPVAPAGTAPDTPTSSRDRGGVVVMLIGAVAMLEPATFLIGALLHIGVRLPLGFAVLDEPRIIPATVVEGAAAGLLAVGAFTTLTRRAWAWPAAVVAHVVAIAGVLLGIGALAAGRGPETELNHVYHRTMLVALAAVLTLLLSPAGRSRPTPRVEDADR